MTSALIGFTGYVGSTLTRSRSYDFEYNSKNIQEIAGRSFDIVVCAGAKAAKWQANADPVADLAAIDHLMDNLRTVKAKRFVLISTIDVYGNPVDVTEKDLPPREGLHPYGLHRLLIEDFVRETFDRRLVVRLPGLFGAGLRKNVIYDMIHKNQASQINPAGRLQWYPMRRLTDDIDLLLTTDIELINVAPEPLLTSEIAQRFFPDVSLGEARQPAPNYDVRTLHPGLFGWGVSGYHFGRATILNELETFIAAEREEL